MVLRRAVLALRTLEALRTRAVRRPAVPRAVTTPAEIIPEATPVAVTIPVAVTRIDTVYIGKDSLSVENKKIGLSASADGGSKKSGLSELFLCHDSGKPKRAWSLRSLLHRFLTYVKWITALICAVVVLIITIKVCSQRR